jgi:hypothetical protein
MTPRRFFPGIAAAALALGVAGLVAPPTLAQVAAAPRGAEGGLQWQELAASHRAALKPLEAQWNTISADQKQKWVELAARFPALSPDERSRVQGRMAEWAQLSPRERGQARINFQEAKQVSPQDRQAQWEAYQALPAEQKRQLAARAEPLPKVNPLRPNLSAALADEAPAAKSNIVPNPAHAQPLRQVAPTVVQAQPGATTTLITKRPVPPAHQQTGLPKIAATPEFVDKATLLPQRGPQGAAATRSAAASDAQANLRR